MQTYTVEQQFINAMLAVDGLSDDYRVSVDGKQAAEFLHRADAQCECNPDLLVQFIGAINAIVPPMQFKEGNPNNGKPHHKFAIGREYSRVVYLDLAKAYFHSGYDFARFAEAIVQVGRNFHATESDLKEESVAGLLFRFWWKRCDECEF